MRNEDEKTILGSAVVVLVAFNLLDAALARLQSTEVAVLRCITGWHSQEWQASASLFPFHGDDDDQDSVREIISPR